MPLLRGSIPILSNVADLVRFFEVPFGLLSSIQRHPARHYRTFEIPKRKGGLRIIEAPQPTLQAIQSKIHHEILASVVVHDAAHGFVQGRSIVSNATCHLAGRHFLRLDLQDFFPSTKATSVEKVFNELGYASDVGKVLTGICTIRGGLPQGAPTSPALSNLCAKDLDVRLSSLARANRLTYTRYADDITFSGHFVSLTFVQVVREAIQSYQYLVNEKKTLLSRNGGKNIVTGISVSRNELRAPKSFKRNTRLSAHFLLRNGIVFESRRMGIFDPFYVDRVLGKLSFWHMVEPRNKFPIEMRGRILERLGRLQRRARRGLL